MHFGKILQQMKISRYKPFASFCIVKKQYYKSSTVLSIKTFNNLDTSKYIKKEIIHSGSSKKVFEELSEDSLISCMMSSNNEWFYSLLCPNLPVSHQEESLISDLQNSYSIEDFFEVLDRHEKPLNYNEACQAIYSISNIKHLHQHKFKNSLMKLKHNRDFFSLINSHPKFNDILLKIKDEKSIERLCPLMMCLDNIGVALNNDLMIDLHLKILNSIFNLDIPSLVQFSFVFGNKSKLSYYTQVKIFNEVHKRVDFDQLSITNLLFLSVLYNNMHKILSMEEKLKYVYHVKTFTEKNKFNDSEIANLFLILSTIKKLFIFNVPVNECKSIMKLFVNKIGDLSPQQISVLSGIYLNVLEPRCLLPKLQEVASNYINELDNKALKTDLLLCLLFNARFKKKKKYEILVSEVINLPFECQDGSSTFKALRFLDISNYEICNRFWSNSIENVKEKLAECEDVIGSREYIMRSFYAKYIYFNDNFYGKVRLFEIEQEMISLLQSEIHGSSKVIPTKIAHMIGFMIAYSKKNELSEQWYELLEKNKVQLNFIDVHFLSRGLQLQLLNNVHDAKGSEFLSKIKSLLDSCTEKLLQKTLYLQDVQTLATAYLNRQGSPSASLFQKISNSHLKHIEEITSSNIKQVLRNFSNAKFANPEVFEVISDYVVINQEDICSTVVHQVLIAFFRLGYTPKNSEFVGACQTVVNSEREIMPYKALLQCCSALSFLRGLNTELIHYIFCIEILKEIDEEMECSNITNFSTSVRSLLMNLNRAVCLDYPEEKIPWFHEKYCQDNREMKPRVIAPFQKEVADVLSSILGKEEYIAFNTTSPYYHNIDLEFAVGKDGIPLSRRNFERLQNGNITSSKDLSEIRRFAVFVRNKNSYTVNDHTLFGFYQLQRRHLEMQGFFVVDVLERDFFSMAVGTFKEKKILLKNLIMREALKEFR